jgi:hypothetical protein
MLCVWKITGVRGKVSLFFRRCLGKFFSAAYHALFDGHRWRKSIDNDEHGTEGGKGSRSF